MKRRRSSHWGAYSLCRMTLSWSCWSKVCQHLQAQHNPPTGLQDRHQAHYQQDNSVLVQMAPKVRWILPVWGPLGGPPRCRCRNLRLLGRCSPFRTGCRFSTAGKRSATAVHRPSQETWGAYMLSRAPSDSINCIKAVAASLLSSIGGAPHAAKHQPAPAEGLALKRPMAKPGAAIGQQVSVRSHSSGCRTCLQTCSVMPVWHWASHLSPHLLLIRCGSSPMFRLVLAMRNEQAVPKMFDCPHAASCLAIWGAYHQHPLLHSSS